MVKQKTVHGIDSVKRKTASVVMHGYGQLPCNEQWEVNLDATPAGMTNDPSGAFLPQSGTKRPQPHTKINDCDH